jgi:hypothetical protein
MRAAHRCETLDLRDVRYWHDARQDWHTNANLAQAFDERKVVSVVEKELRYDEVGTRFHLSLEVGKVASKIRGFSVFLWVAGDPNAELGVSFLNECYELVGVRKSAVRRYEFCLPFRGIPAQRKNVLDSASLELVENLGYLVTASAGTSKVSHGLDPRFLFDSAHELER